MASDNNVTETDISLDSGFPPSGRQYRPVFAQDRDLAVLEMSSIDPNRGASSSDSFTDSNDNRKIKPGVDPSTNTEGQDRSLHNHEDVNGLQRESKLELFGFDSLVNILGLKSMTGDSIPAPSSPRDGEDAIHPDRLKNNGDKLGTMMGVFVHCVQNMLGIIYYIRFSWIVGMAGIGLLLVAFCGSCTFLTTISLSAIATDGAMKGGGLYYLIGRALGLEVGVSIGLCFFLGNAVAGSPCVLGAVETFLKALPQARFFKESHLSPEFCTVFGMGGCIHFVSGMDSSITILVIVGVITLFVMRILYILYRRSKPLNTIPLGALSTLIILGSGGHTAEMLNLLAILQVDNFKPRYYIAAVTDNMSLQKAREMEKSFLDKAESGVVGTFHLLQIYRSREVGQSYITSVGTTLVALAHALWLMIKIRPQVILCNGPGTCIPLCVIAFFFKVFGIRRSSIFYIESIARVRRLSLSGLLLYRLRMADQLFVQWPQLKNKYPRAHYVGRLM